MAAFNIWHLLTRLPRWPLRADPFDEEHGTETSGIRHIASLDVLGSPSARYAVHYEPSSGQLVHAQLDKLTIDAARFTFTDFGSGKGRVLFIAAGLPFKAVIGVEFSRELHVIALRNIALLPPTVGRARLAAHHLDLGFQVIVIYAAPRHRGIFEQAGVFTVFDESSEVVILTTCRERAPNPNSRRQVSDDLKPNHLDR